MSIKHALRLSDLIDPRNFDSSVEKYSKGELANALRELAGAYRRACLIREKQKNKIRIRIVVSKGLVEDVYADEDIDLEILDTDTLHSDDESIEAEKQFKEDVKGMKKVY